MLNKRVVDLFIKFIIILNCCILLVLGGQHPNYEKYRNIFKIRNEINRHDTTSLNSMLNMFTIDNVSSFTLPVGLEWRKENEVHLLEREIRKIDSLNKKVLRLNSIYINESNKLIKKWLYGCKELYNENSCFNFRDVFEPIYDKYIERQNEITKVFIILSEMLSTIGECYNDYYKTEQKSIHFGTKISKLKFSYKLIKIKHEVSSFNYKISTEHIDSFRIRGYFIDLESFLLIYKYRRYFKEYRYNKSVKEIIEGVDNHFNLLGNCIFESLWHEKSLNDLAIILDNSVVLKESVKGIVLKDKVNKRGVKKVYTLIDNTELIIKKYDAPL
jgi:hypothetical protein